MQDVLLRVFVVALSLLTYPRDDPGVEEWDDITTVDMQKHEERLLRGEKMNQDKLSLLEDVTVTKQDSEEGGADQKLQEGRHFVANSDPSRPQNSKSEPEPALKTSQTDGSFIDPSRPQGQQERPEEKEEFSSKEQEPPLSHLHTEISENETSETSIADWEKDYLWYMWNMISIISMIRFFRKYMGRNSQMNQKETGAVSVTCTAAEVPLPDSDTLQRFHSKCIQVFDNKWSEFLEGFANDLLDAMRTVCDKNSGMLIEDFQMVGVYDIIIPFTPPDPYSFQCQLWNNQATQPDLLPAMQVGGQIELVENKKIQNGCPCQSPDGDDMVCLLHCETEKVKTKRTDVCDSLLCMKNSSFLSKSQVTKWFQSTIKQAWALISHKYEFELNIRYMDAPGALVVRFRSGKKINFRINPVVKFNTDAYFFITPRTPNNLDTFWTLSLANYEDRFLKHICKHLPENSCHSQTLEIAYFLHRRQTALSGCRALKDFHFKTALMHLLLTKGPSQWKPNYVAFRLRDLLAFMEKSLKKKLLHHVLIGNPFTQRVIALPAEFTQTKSVNLFHPLVVHDCIYRDAVLHFQEMLRHAQMLIHDYVDQCIDSAN